MITPDAFQLSRAEIEKIARTHPSPVFADTGRTTREQEPLTMRQKLRDQISCGQDI